MKNMEGASVIIDGTTKISENREIPFRYENGFLELFIGNDYHTFKEDTIYIIGRKREVMVGGFVLFHLSLPLQNCCTLNIVEEGTVKESKTSFGKVRNEIDYYIDDYVDDSKFSKMRFTFPELDYFIPSSSMSKYSPDNDYIEFFRVPVIISSFLFNFMERPVKLTLESFSTFDLSAKASAETKSQLTFEFEETDDLDFFKGLYTLVKYVFSFLCNRQNIALDSGVLLGTHCLKIKEMLNSIEKVTDKQRPVFSRMYVFDKYKEESENKKIIAETIRYSFLASAFESLFLLFVNGKISVSSIHSSRKSRNLFDLKQCLNITAAFEFYHRTFLPEILSETTAQVYAEIKALITEYASTQTGKKKAKAKRFIESISPNVSLQDKICKVYDGYNNWVGLKTILSDYFGEDVSDLATIANQWRNELAHEKREYEPDNKVISSIRLVEHLNYCIVLRNAGYTDDIIKAVISQILTR